MKEMNVTPTINVKLSGPIDAARDRIQREIERPATSRARAPSSLGGPDRVFQGEVAVHHLDLAPFLNNPEQKSDIIVYAKVDVRGPGRLRHAARHASPRMRRSSRRTATSSQGIRANAKIDGRTIAFDTSERAYRSNTTAAGSVEFASDARPETRFDLRGVVKDVGLAYLPKQTRVPPAETKLTADYHVSIVIPREARLACGRRRHARRSRPSPASRSATVRRRRSSFEPERRAIRRRT